MVKGTNPATTQLQSVKIITIFFFIEKYRFKPKLQYMNKKNITKNYIFAKFNLSFRPLRPI